MGDKTVVGVFRSQSEAERAVNDLRREGFQDNEISIVARDQGREQEGRREGGGQEGGRQGGRDGFGDQDVSEGVVTGGAIGGVGGLLASAGALAVPGIGPVLALGPLAAALSGAVAGGVAGGLIDWGVPEERGRFYEQEVRQGRILAAIRCDDRRVDKAAEVLRHHGASNVEAHNAR